MSFVTCDPDVLLSADAGEVCALTATQVLATLRASGHLYAATEAARAIAAG
jgi:hypothetical protein